MCTLTQKCEFWCIINIIRCIISRAAAICGRDTHQLHCITNTLFSPLGISSLEPSWIYRQLQYDSNFCTCYNMKDPGRSLTSLGMTHTSFLAFPVSNSWKNMTIANNVTSNRIMKHIIFFVPSIVIFPFVVYSFARPTFSIFTYQVLYLYCELLTFHII